MILSKPEMLLDLGSDIALRRAWFTNSSFAHPAKLHLGLLRWIIERYTQPGDTIADPMSGTGGLLLAVTLQRNVILREVEPRWLAICHENAAKIITKAGMFAGSIDIGQADTRQPWDYKADHLIFSPPYGCSAGTTPLAKGVLSHKKRIGGGRLGDRWKTLLRNTDSNQGALGSMIFCYGGHPDQIGHLRNTAYWVAMHDIYKQAAQGLKPDGYMVLIVKDHIRDGSRVPVAADTVRMCSQLGFHFVERHARRVYPLSLWQRRRKERGEPVVETEDILVFRKDVSP